MTIHTLQLPRERSNHRPLYMTWRLAHNGRFAACHQPIPGCRLTTQRPDTYSDEYIEHWGRIYEANRLRARNILFHAFLQAPMEILAAIGQQAAPALSHGEEFYPLLPRQQMVQERLDHELDVPAIEAAMTARLEREHEKVAFRGWRWIEPMLRRAMTKVWKYKRRAVA